MFQSSSIPSPSSYPSRSSPSPASSYRPSSSQSAFFSPFRQGLFFNRGMVQSEFREIEDTTQMAGFIHNLEQKTDLTIDEKLEIIQFWLKQCDFTRSLSWLNTLSCENNAKIQNYRLKALVGLGDEAAVMRELISLSSSSALSWLENNLLLSLTEFFFKRGSLTYLTSYFTLIQPLIPPPSPASWFQSFLLNVLMNGEIRGNFKVGFGDKMFIFRELLVMGYREGVELKGVLDRAVENGMVEEVRDCLQVLSDFGLLNSSNFSQNAMKMHLMELIGKCESLESMWNLLSKYKCKEEEGDFSELWNLYVENNQSELKVAELEILYLKFKSEVVSG